MALTENEQKTINGYILFGVTPHDASGRHWKFKTTDWRYGFDSMSPYKASIVISYILNETPTEKQEHIVQKYKNTENLRKSDKGIRFRSELLQILKLRNLLFGYESLFHRETPLYKTLNLKKDDVYDYVKSELIEYLMTLGFLHIPQDFVKLDEPLHSPTIQKKPFAPEFDYNKSISEALDKKPKNIIITEPSKYGISYWVPPLLNFTMVFDALYTTFNSAINTINASIKISLDIIKEWHNHIHQDVLESEIKEPYMSR